MQIRIETCRFPIFVPSNSVGLLIPFCITTSNLEKPTGRREVVKVQHLKHSRNTGCSDTRKQRNKYLSHPLGPLQRVLEPSPAPSRPHLLIREHILYRSDVLKILNTTVSIRVSFFLDKYPCPCLNSRPIQHRIPHGPSVLSQGCEDGLHLGAARPLWVVLHNGGVAHDFSESGRVSDLAD